MAPNRSWLGAIGMYCLTATGPAGGAWLDELGQAGAEAAEDGRVGCRKAQYGFVATVGEPRTES
ncbi:hypothetical protein Snoj_56570 [Streptomyces nojiriensis]|uniref:Uncharacterized protein n=1 Tax=Streptomyces nojiriensis TaxID=66374 RepID=A0ABQ3SUB3_9ACTN|nr:hypothetical protein [Streptomyces nojiriensis]QTI45279.1 hypothetical protein JYK04_03062 [Streptomyces nojiriensis]GGR94652.1 hypothetical protein GCM10010205_24100 [Streptomyces nojiriensis]GHI71739.1 hypothetical protein Snoj_56570 [Streptomyces nojiriensis]